VESFARAIAATGLFLAAFIGAGCSGGATGAAGPSATPVSTNDAFSSPQKVTIAGYTGTAMEPFVSRDGKYLFFNDSNAPGNDTNLFWATRTNALTFQYQGEIAGANSTALDAVASMDLAGNFYFISTRSYATTSSTVYHGTFSNGTLSGVALVPNISLQTPGVVTFDEEVSADGGTLYIAEGNFSGGAGPTSSQIIVAHGSATSGFVRDPNSAALLANVNTGTLQYAPDITPSGRELFFTRGSPAGFATYVATRADTSSPFGVPVPIAAISGYSEAPSLAPDGKTLYYHHSDDGGVTFSIYCVTRNAPGP
jgi:Tol biopolymer transport system component